MLQRKPVDDPWFWRRRIYSTLIRSGRVHEAVCHVNAATWQSIQEETGRILSKYLPRNGTLLDAGCGCGDVFALLPSSARYIGVDLSPDFIEIAKLRYPFVRFEVAALDDLGLFDDDVFDLAVGRSVEGTVGGNMPDGYWDRCVAEVLRVAKRFLLIDYGNAFDRESGEPVRLDHKVLERS